MRETYLTRPLFGSRRLLEYGRIPSVLEKGQILYSSLQSTCLSTFLNVKVNISRIKLIGRQIKGNPVLRNVNICIQIKSNVETYNRAKVRMTSTLSLSHEQIAQIIKILYIIFLTLLGLESCRF